MGQIHESIISIMGEVDAIAKDKKNESQGFKYRGIDDVYNTLHSLMAKHGIFTTSEIKESVSEVHTTKSGAVMFHEKMLITYTFFAKDGSSVSSTVKGVGMDSGDKAANKAMAIGHKYAMIQIFAIPTVDLIDPDAERPEGEGIKPKPESKTAANVPAKLPQAQAPDIIPENNQLEVKDAKIIKAEIATTKTGKTFFVVNYENAVGEAGRMSSFSESVYEEVKQMEGKTCSILYELDKTGKYKNIIGTLPF